MDPAARILWAAPAGGIDKSCVRVSYDPEQFGRQLHPSDERIDECWAEACAANARLFNGEKFRLHRVSSTNDAGVHLQLGLTDYKDYLGTNRRPHTEFRALAIGNRRESNPGLPCSSVLRHTLHIPCVIP